MVIGIVLLSNEGCNTKGLKSEGERGSGSAGTKLPNLSERSSSGELSGLSRNPSEERLAQGEYSEALTPSGVSPRQRAELTREEQAAVEAGLQDVSFHYNQSALSDACMEAFNHDATYLNSHPAAVLHIEGH